MLETEPELSPLAEAPAPAPALDTVLDTALVIGLVAAVELSNDVATADGVALAVPGNVHDGAEATAA